ncbi:hypothetical protein EDD15DRAFT_2257301 [Pisolithus albus]|nr:hypothetical protein EDD15DRAFT_2257301 [Pisolithus albus]
MARLQSKTRRGLLGYAKPSNSAPGLASPPGGSQAGAEDFASVSEISGTTSTGRFARMRRFFHQSNTGVAEQWDQRQLAPPQGAAATITDGAAQDKQVEPFLAPTKVGQVEKSTNKSEPIVLAGKDVHAAVHEFGSVIPISPVTKGAVDGVGRANAAFTEIQHLSDTYLRPFRVFNQVVATLANIHPYAQAAIGILASVSLVYPQFQFQFAFLFSPVIFSCWRTNRI